tara:strand:- start:5296 stop:6045 length:750 start_codon:yes stop_codon:yes gene_type:complete
MSIRSLLQIILFLLIILIIGGIYFLYFYTSSTNSEVSLNKSLDDKTIKSMNTNISLDQELLEDSGINKKDKSNNKNLLNKNYKPKGEQNNLISNKKLDETNLKNLTESKKNITKNIEYITTNENGDILKILAKYGRTNLNDSKILDLEEVNGVISPVERLEIYITSDYAKYNYANQNSKFYGNVKVNYDNKEITCDNLDLNINQNIAVAYNNVIMIDNKSKMKAENIKMNLITKDIDINSNKKIKVTTN